jgi:hypothetical protein
MDLNVPYEEKDAAKALGARWDPTRRTWYVPAGVDINKFARWNSELEAWNRAADGRGKAPRLRKQRREKREKAQGKKQGKGVGVEQGGEVSYIAGNAITGKHYAPSMCPDCETKLPWEPQCDACTAAFEGRRAVARAEAGVVGSTSAEKHDRLRNTNSFDEFMARQLRLPLVESVE